MKAMILAAGLGTRLRPYTNDRPKALFTINNRPMLELAIERLRQAGFQTILVNTHHCHRQIEQFVDRTDFGITVETHHEPDILGTGGALRNVAKAWSSEPLLVLNADILSDIDLAAVFQFHQEHNFPVTMVMHDHVEFNTVAVNVSGFVNRFRYGPDDPGTEQSMAFTGIHVIDPRVLDYLPPSGPAHIIKAYGDMLAAAEKIKAYIVRDHVWHDIGTPQRYQQAAMDYMVPPAFEAAFGTSPQGSFNIHRLHGDGSDRQWHRVESGGRTLIVADHGILPAPGQQEVDAYVDIGRHLAQCGVSVPEIFHHDRCSGLVFVEDLGQELLQTGLAQMEDEERQRYYCRIIDHWITMAMEGVREFDVAWTFQTPHYDREIILEKECRYFMQAFIQDHLDWNTTYESLASEFEWLADQIEEHGVPGLIHRDFQSRNIMVKNGNPYFIDFQGGRLGPVQYDLASLLIDPYAALPHSLQERLCEYAANEMERRHGTPPRTFFKGYSYCALARNLQILGAFAFLTDTKHKTWFADYIPRAIASLDHNLSQIPASALSKLRSLSQKLLELSPKKV